MYTIGHVWVPLWKTPLHTKFVEFQLQTGYLKYNKYTDVNGMSGFPVEDPTIYKVPTINLFINSDAILNRDALWSIQGKNHHVNAAIVGGIRRTGKVLR